MKSHANLIREFIDDVLNHGNIEATGEYLHEDVVELARFPGQGPGLSGLKDVLHRFHSRTCIGWSRSKLRKVTRSSADSFGRAPFEQNFGRSGDRRRVSIWGIAVDRIVDGKIKDTRFIMDALGLMAQMGVFAPGGKLQAET